MQYNTPPTPPNYQAQRANPVQLGTDPGGFPFPLTPTIYGRGQRKEFETPGPAITAERLLGAPIRLPTSLHHDWKGDP